MDFGELDLLRRNDPAWRLLRAAAGIEQLGMPGDMPSCSASCAATMPNGSCS